MSMFSALSHRNFRLFWLGQCVSLVGTWMQNVGQAWLILQLTNSPFLLGLITTLQTLPIMIFSLFIGVFVDRFPKRNLVIFAQTGLMILAFTLSFLTLTGTVKYWHVAVLATMLGFMNTIDNPSRQSLMIELVGKEDLLNAIALNSSAFNLARIIGPAVAGIMIGYLGIGICFLINGLSFVAVIIGLLFIDVKGERRSIGQDTSVMKDMMEGIRYIFKTPKIYVAMLLMFFISTFAMNFNILVPVYTKMDLGLDASRYGFLMSAMGAGALAGALSLAAGSKRGPRMRLLFLGALGLSVFQGILGLMNNIYTAMIFIAITGFFMITFTATCNTTIQINSEDNIRGRVMSVYTLVFSGVAPIGSMYTGILSENMGAGMTFVISGVIGVASCLIAYMAGKNRGVSI